MVYVPSMPSTRLLCPPNIKLVCYHMVVCVAASMAGACAMTILWVSFEHPERAGIDLMTSHTRGVVLCGVMLAAILSL